MTFWQGLNLAQIGEMPWWHRFLWIAVLLYALPSRRIEIGMRDEEGTCCWWWCSLVIVYMYAFQAWTLRRLLTHLVIYSLTTTHQRRDPAPADLWSAALPCIPLLRASCWSSFLCKYSAMSGRYSYQAGNCNSVMGVRLVGGRWSADVSLSLSQWCSYFLKGVPPRHQTTARPALPARRRAEQRGAGNGM